MYGGDTSFGRTKVRDAHRVPVESLDRAAWEIFTRGVGRPNLVRATNREHAL
jgi:hypothetical protein